LKEKKGKNGLKSIFKEIMAENSPNLEKIENIHIEEAEKFSIN
jgi:hypothetical protein